MPRVIHSSKIILIILLMQVIGNLAFAENAQDYNNRGVYFLDDGYFEKAREYLEKAYDLAPGNKVIKKNLANTYAGLAYKYDKESDWPSALEFGEKAYELDQTDTRMAKNLSVIYNNYGLAQMKERNFEKALANFERSLELDNKNWTAYVNIGNLMYQQGKTAEAVNYWKEALAIHPDIPDVKDKVSSLEKENKIGEKFNRQEYSHFEVKYEGYARQDLASKALLILNEAYYKIGSDFNFYPTEKVTVMIYTKDQYGEVTGNPDWLPGQAEGNGTIRLTANDIEKSKERLEDVLYHEYTHILLYRKIGLKIPRWLDEGLAQYKEPSSGTKLTAAERALLEKHQTNGDLISLTDLARAWDSTRDQETVNLAYVEAKSLILYLVDRYNLFQLILLLDKFKNSQDINKALKDTFYLDTGQLEQSWLAWLKSK